MNAGGPVLRDIHLPPAPWWPPAAGWWLVLALWVLAMALAGWWLWWRVQRRPLVAALRELDALAQRFRLDHDHAALATGASCLLRRVAVSVDRQRAAASGEAWRDFLHRHVASASEAAQLDPLLDAPFRVRPAFDAQALLAATRTCCRRALRPRLAWGWRARLRGLTETWVRGARASVGRARGGEAQTTAHGRGHARP